MIIFHTFSISSFCTISKPLDSAINNKYRKHVLFHVQGVQVQAMRNPSSEIDKVDLSQPCGIMEIKKLKLLGWETILSFLGLGLCF